MAHKEDDFGRLEEHEEAAGTRKRGRLHKAEVEEVPPDQLMTNVVVTKEEPGEVDGVIRTVGTAALTLVTSPAAERGNSIVIPSKAEIVLNGKHVNLWDLRAGDKVSVKSAKDKDQEGEPVTVSKVTATRQER